jgi:hypothetical protein
MEKKFQAELQAGHQEDALEVPFVPRETWTLVPERLWRGRKGYKVLAKVDKVSFEGFIVSRQRKSLLVEDDVKQAAGIGVGDVVTVTVERRTKNT